MSRIPPTNLICKSLNFYLTFWPKCSKFHAFNESFIHSFIHWLSLGRPNQSLSHMDLNHQQISKKNTKKWSKIIKKPPKILQKSSQNLAKAHLQKKTCPKFAPKSTFFTFLRIFHDFWLLQGPLERPFLLQKAKKSDFEKCHVFGRAFLQIWYEILLILGACSKPFFKHVRKHRFCENEHFVYTKHSFSRAQSNFQKSVKSVRHLRINLSVSCGAHFWSVFDRCWPSVWKPNATETA